MVAFGDRQGGSLDAAGRVLVIGVSSALGAEVARQRCAYGYRVHGTFTGRRPLPLWLTQLLSGTSQFDVTSDEDLVMLSRADRFGGQRFDEIYYMVGVASAGLEALTQEDQRRVMGINYERAHPVLRQLRDHHLADNGVMVVASSAAAWWRLEYAPGYCRAKACLNSTLEYMANVEGTSVVIWTPGAIDTAIWQQEGIPEEVQTAVRLCAPSALTAVRWLLQTVDARGQHGHSAAPVLTTLDAWLTYHVPLAAQVVNFALSGLVELDAVRRGRLPWRPRAVLMLPGGMLLRLVGRMFRA